MDAVDEGAEFAGVDEEGLLAAVAEAAFGVGGFVFREDVMLPRGLDKFYDYTSCLSSRVRMVCCCFGVL